MDAVFTAGKFKGRWFSDVAGQETSFVAWAKKQKTPPGYLRAFLDFLKQGRRGQRSLDGLVVKTPRAPARPAESEQVTEDGGEGRGLRFDFLMALEVVGPELFEVGPEDQDAEVPHTLRAALARHRGATAAPGASRWRFPAALYAEVLRWLEWNPDFRCRVEPVPVWVLKRLPAFAASAEQVQAVAALRLSLATKRLLAELPKPAPKTPPTRTVEDYKPVKGLDLDGLGGQLLPFQVEAVEFGLRHHARFLLGDEMGLGKTITALALAKHFLEAWPVLVIAPAPLCRVWQDQALRWLPKLLAPKDVVVVRSGQEVVPTAAKMVVVSYNLLSAALQDSSTPGSFREFQMVIVDECHQLRGQSSKRAQAVVPLARRAKHALLLTGTLLVARAEDAYPLLESLLPEGELPSVNDFAARYGRRGAQRLQELHALLGSVMLRRTKVEMLPQLPKKRRRRVLLDLGPSGPSASARPAREEPVEEACERLATAKKAAVAEYLSCLLAANVRFLVFAHHLAMLDALEKSLREQSIRYFRIDGSTLMAERSKYIDAFQTTDHFQVALLSLTACSQGFTLSAASLVVFAELYWVPGTLLQAEDRAHRLGQENMVDVHYLVAPGTVDERMLAAVERRARDADAAVDGGTATALPAREGGILEAPVVDEATAVEEVASGAKRKTPPRECEDDLVLIGPRSSGRPFAWAKISIGLQILSFQS
eukprot:s5487_g1.t1